MELFGIGGDGPFEMVDPQLAVPNAEPFRDTDIDRPVWRFLAESRATVEYLLGLLEGRDSVLADLAVDRGAPPPDLPHAQALALLDRYRRALVRIASFDEGDVVDSSFQEPDAAMLARAALGEGTRDG